MKFSEILKESINKNDRQRIAKKILKGKKAKDKIDQLVLIGIPVDPSEMNNSKKIEVEHIVDELGYRSDVNDIKEPKWKNIDFKIINAKREGNDGMAVNYWDVTVKTKWADFIRLHNLEEPI